MDEPKIVYVPQPRVPGHPIIYHAKVFQPSGYTTCTFHYVESVPMGATIVDGFGNRSIAPGTPDQQFTKEDRT